MALGPSAYGAAGRGDGVALPLSRRLLPALGARGTVQRSEENRTPQVNRRGAALDPVYHEVKQLLKQGDA